MYSEKFSPTTLSQAGAQGDRVQKHQYGLAFFQVSRYFKFFVISHCFFADFRLKYRAESVAMRDPMFRKIKLISSINSVLIAVRKEFKFYLPIKRQLL
jgi:hypothetical protein